MTIIFIVEESRAGNSPVVFDNFVWFTDTELTEAVKREVPAFNGTAPNAGGMTDSITAALQKLLNERNIKGTVEYLPSQDDFGSAAMLHVFTVAGNVVRICTIRYPGANNISRVQVAESFRGPSLDRILKKVFQRLRPHITLVQCTGKWDSCVRRFKQPLVTVSAESKCKGGVDLTIPVEEGSIFIWEKAEWSDNSVLDAAALDKELGMKSGEVANGLKIDKGLAADQKSLRPQGIHGAATNVAT